MKKADVERDVEVVLVAYEEVLRKKHGRRVPAQRTRNMINWRGVIPAVERLVRNKKNRIGYTMLVEEGKPELTFEAVVLRYPKSFSPRAVTRARERLEGLGRSRS
jgi:hypothetical protein